VGDNGPSVLGPHFLLSNFVSSFMMDGVKL
jgi:hypothetical protein